MNHRSPANETGEIDHFSTPLYSRDRLGFAPNSTHRRLVLCASLYRSSKCLPIPPLSLQKLPVGIEPTPRDYKTLVLPLNYGSMELYKVEPNAVAHIPYCPSITSSCGVMTSTDYLYLLFGISHYPYREILRGRVELPSLVYKTSALTVVLTEQITAVDGFEPSYA